MLNLAKLDLDQHDLAALGGDFAGNADGQAGACTLAAIGVKKGAAIN